MRQSTRDVLVAMHERTVLAIEFERAARDQLALELAQSQQTLEQLEQRRIDIDADLAGA